MKAEPHFAGDPSPSPSVNADRIVWRWTDENNRVHRVTNACGWAVPAATNVFRPVWLRIDVGLLGGVYTFSLSGADGAFRVWPDASGTNAAPLLTGGQTVTNWAGGVTFLSGDDADLYVEAVRNGTSTLIYSYAGTGGAEGISCEASLKMTAGSFRVVPDYDRDGEIGDDDRHAASTNAVFRFWINDDRDVDDTAEAAARISPANGFARPRGRVIG